MTKHVTTKAFRHSKIQKTWNYISGTISLSETLELYLSEAASGAVLKEVVFLSILQISQENIYVEVDGSPTQVFSCGICKIFNNTYFEEHLQTTASQTCSNFTRTALF